ncbi:hypothetical protein M5X06_22455 [Paenibacillus alvei]|uniref:Uncharacterized protein n=1 Tax=Paenibacillus alvei TaxID=44250 RepID=A0ABT4H2F1_PAEAL|nr:hypothetical protein [Paenibacillus alvei]MCY9763157.1 hypothetical protein [Paenibacillus alvei]MCY9769552.1 hypothetical protein [Paenibacillus alvei]
MKIEVYTSICIHCSNDFFEIDGEVNRCPHCGADTADATGEGKRKRCYISFTGEEIAYLGGLKTWQI